MEMGIELEWLGGDAQSAAVLSVSQLTINVSCLSSWSMQGSGMRTRETQ